MALHWWWGRDWTGDGGFFLRSIEVPDLVESTYFCIFSFDFRSDPPDFDR